MRNKLTPSQRNVLRELCFGDPNIPAIASKLHVTERTAETYIAQIREVYGFRNKIQLLWHFRQAIQVRQRLLSIAAES